MGKLMLRNENTRDNNNRCKGVCNGESMYPNPKLRPEMNDKHRKHVADNKKRNQRYRWPTVSRGVKKHWTERRPAWLPSSSQESNFCHPPDFIILDSIHLVQNAGTVMQCGMKRFPTWWCQTHACCIGSRT